MPNVSEKILNCAKQSKVLWNHFVLNNLHIWKLMIDTRVNHSKYGIGKIAEVKLRYKNLPLIKIKYNNQNEYIEFNTDSFHLGFFLEIDPPTAFNDAFEYWETHQKGIVKKQLEERKQKQKARDKRIKEAEKKREVLRQAAVEKKKKEKAALEEFKKKEKAALEEFDDLKKKYNVFEKKFSIVSQMNSILLKMESGEPLNDEDIKYLNDKKCENVTATYFFRSFNKDGDIWKLIKACSCLRRCDKPEKVIEITNTALGKGGIKDKALSALLTTRGGAYRDLGENLRAKQCAHDAIRKNQANFYPYNLLGAIYYALGEYHKGDAYFDKAQKCGANSRSQEKEIISVLKGAQKNERNRIAEYLLNKDPKKYNWITKYI